MNKKLIAVAVGSALGVIGMPAFAQSSTVTLSGNLNYMYGYYDNGGAGYANATANSIAPGVAKNRTDSLTNSESEWVLTGEENLGGGMAAFFRCASTMDLTGAGASIMCGRTSYIGMKGGFGAVSFGNNDTPIKQMIALYDPFPISAPTGQGAQMFNGVSSAAGNSGNVSGAASSFSRRQNNLITYSMPTMNGFDAAVAYSAANEATGSTSASTITKPRMYSVMANYTNGPLKVGIGYERHIDFNPGSGQTTAATVVGTIAGAATGAMLGTYKGGRDSSYQMGAAYTFNGSLTVSAIYANMKYDNIDGFGADMSVSTYGLYGAWAISGPHSLKLGYGVQGSTKGTFIQAVGAPVGVYTANGGAGQSGSQKFHGEYSYAMSKRTEVSLGYARISNDRNSNINVGTGSSFANFGETQSYGGMRVNHKF